MNKVIIIAEAGVNHNGEINKVFKLIDIASKAKVDYIKFQTYVTDELVTKFAKTAKYQFKNSKHTSQYKMLKKYELSYENHYKIINYCKKKGIKFLSSAFDIKSLYFLKSLKLDFFKVPSGEINNYHYLKILGKFKKKILLSTGASNMKEIITAINILNKYGTPKKNISVLHCNSSYPTPIKDTNLLAIQYLKKKLNLNVGFSDHTLGIDAALASVVLGAKIIEKHITINKKLNGPDHKSSLDPMDLSRLVKSVRNIELALGSAKKKITKSEKINQKLIRKSIVAKTDINKGEKFTLKNIALKRPGFGKSPMKINKILGKKSSKKIYKDNFV